MAYFDDDQWRKLPRRLARRLRRSLKAGGYRLVKEDGTPVSELAARLYLAGALQAHLADLAGVDDDE